MSLGATSKGRANYTFTDDGLDENGLARVVMRPLRKERPLIVGRMFLTPGMASWSASTGGSREILHTMDKSGGCRAVIPPDQWSTRAGIA
jgi:hypothetical protein